MDVTVVGTGYLGAAHAACLAAEGHRVVGIDRDAERVRALQAGSAPFREEGLDDLLSDGISSGRLRFTTSYDDADGAAVHFLCVGTPEAPTRDADGTAPTDLTALWGALEGLAPHLADGSLVVGRSTVPVGTAARARDLLRERTPAGVDVALAWNPEFLREGHAVADSLHPHRIVVGAEDERSFAVLREIYRPWTDRDVPLVECDLPTAELAKLAANAMLAIRVSTVNVLAELCEASGADVGALVEIVGRDPRIGRAYLDPGLGYGGSCLPKDIRGLAHRAQELGVDMGAEFLRIADDVNEWQRSRTVRLAEDLLGDPRDRKVAVLGATFKGGSDDLRDSPALDVAGRLTDAGAEVAVHDPVATGGSVEETCAGAELVLVLTDWQEYADLDPVALLRGVAVPRVVDARRTLDRDRWEAAGWQVWVLGTDHLAAAHDHAVSA